MPKIQPLHSLTAALMMSLIAACDDGAECAHLSGDAFATCMSAEDESQDFRDAETEEASGDSDDAVCKPKIIAFPGAVPPKTLLPPSSCIPPISPSHQ